MDFNTKRKLSNGYEIPILGYGTWRTPDGDVAVESVAEALRIGYRHIDTAARYENEVSVGEGIRRSGVDRSEIFLTSKLWNTERGYDKAMRAFEKTVNDLGVDYLDLYLLHWPAVKKQFDNWEEINLSSWKALTELYKDGRIKAIGVSNFYEHHLKALMETEIQPMVNQIEFHPGFMQKDTFAYCEKNGILVEAWAPLGAGKVLENETLCEIAAKHSKTSAQVCLRWCLEHNAVPLPKSVTPERILQNTEIFDFELDTYDIARIDELPFIGGSAHNSDEISF